MVNKTISVVQNMRLARTMALTAALVMLAGGASRVFAQAIPATDAVSAAAPVTDPAPQVVVPPTASETPVATPVAAPVAANGKVAAPAGKVKPVKKKKEKAPKQTPMNIVEGTLTLDGWTGKARLNYDIADLKYVYMWAPGVGTVVISNTKFPLGKEEPNAFSGNTLTVTADGHTMELYSQKKLLKDKKPASAWVYVDTAYQMASAFPVMGYGATTQAPYAWPGAKDVAVGKGATVIPPPLPAALRPTLAKTPCVPAGSKIAGTPCPVAPAATPASTPTPAPVNRSAGGTTVAMNP